jgi:AcrR family transcriptional regulator
MEDPRIVRTRDAVLTAATDLLVEGGPQAVTIDAVVARSGVAKSTIYRHWESRDDVLVAVFERCAPTIEAPDAALSWQDAMRSLTHQMVDYLLDPHWARMIPALLMLKAHEHGVADIEARMEEHQNAAMASVVRRGIEAGGLRPDTDVREVVTHLVGPLLFAQLTGTVEVSHELADRTVDIVVAAFAA